MRGSSSKRFDFGAFFSLNNGLHDSSRPKIWVTVSMGFSKVGVAKLPKMLKDAIIITWRVLLLIR